MKNRKILGFISLIFCLILALPFTGLAKGFWNRKQPTTDQTLTSTPAVSSESSEIAAALWLQGVVVRKYGVGKVINECAANGITDILLLVKGNSGVYKFDTLDEVVNVAHPKGIKVHAWVIVLHDDLAQNQGYNMVGKGWVSAMDTKYQNYIMKTIITPLVRDHDIDGVHLDCIRYPGNANNYPGAHDAITNYCSIIRKTMDAYKPSLPLSAATFAEGGGTAYAYGQDIATMSPYLSFITPMTYTHNYKQTPAWVGRQIAYFANKCASGCSMWVGVQTLDDKGSYVTAQEIEQCIKSGISNGAKGAVFFTYPLNAAQWECIKNWKSSL